MSSAQRSSSRDSIHATIPRQASSWPTPLRRRFPQVVLIQADPAAHLVQAAEDELHRRVRPFPPGGILQLHALDELADQGLHDPESFLELEVDLRPAPGL